MPTLLLYLNLAGTVYVLWQIWAKDQQQYTDTEKLIWTVFGVITGLLTAIVLLVIQSRKPRY